MLVTSVSIDRKEADGLRQIKGEMQAAAPGSQVTMTHVVRMLIGMYQANKPQNQE